MRKIMLTLVLLLALMPVSPGAFAQEKQVYVRVNGLTVYASWSTKSKVLGIVGYATPLTLSRVNGDWAEVKNGKAIGYCARSALTEDDLNVFDMTLYAAKNGAKAYKAPVNTAKAFAAINKGDSMRLLAITPDDEWCRVTRLGIYAYMRKSDLTDKNPKAAETTAYVANEFLTAYAKASTTARGLGRLPFGIAVTLMDTAGKWAKVKNSSGTVGYCLYADITSVNPNGEPVTYYVNAAGAPAYQMPETKARVTQTLKQGAAVSVVARTPNGAWARVKLGGAYAYIQSARLSASANAETTVYVTAYTMRAYKKPDVSAKSLGTLPFGQSMTRLAESGDWAYVRNSAGTYGYCLRNTISDINPNGPEVSYYAKKAGAVIYSSTSAASKQLKKCGLNEEIRVIAVTGDGKWLRVSMSGKYGYASSADFLTSQAQPATTVYVTAYTMRAYQKPDVSSKSLGAMPFGQSVTRLGESGDWAYVRNSIGTYGYCLRNTISDINPNGPEVSYYANKAGAIVYSSTSTASNQLKKCGLNEEIRVIAVTGDGKWLRVSMSGKYGYASSADFTITQTQTETQAYVAGYVLSAYAQPKAGADFIGYLAFGAPVTVLGGVLNGGWVRVRNEAGTVGYCQANEVTAKNPNGDKKIYYAQTPLNAYVRPSTASAVRVAFALNAEVAVIAVTEDKLWARVQSGNVYAYVQTAYLGASKANQGGSGYADPYRGTGGAKAESVIALAIQQYGKPYVYAKEGPDSFDCSGLTYYCYKSKAGISLKRSAYEQGYDTRFARVTSVNQLKRGDIVCFNTVENDRDLSDHVGIYLGGGDFIHASSTAGEVIVRNLLSGYYFTHFSWGLRVL